MIDLNPRKDFLPKSATVLGSTGSVGTQTIDVIREMGISVDMLTAGENTSLLCEQIKEFSPKTVAVGSENAAKRLKSELDLMPGTSKPQIIYKKDEVYDAIEHTESDMIFHSVAGLAGLGHALAAARSGKRIGMANKEAIIAAGDVIFDSMKCHGGEMIPVDSEHSAIYRCMEGKDPSDVKRIILTASGGPFFGKTPAELENVTAKEALAHPTWKMGKKITVDSATLMNKGFEIIEAVRLFGKPESQVDVVVHRQSIIHSMIEYNDNTFMAQMGRPDMRDCIRYAASAPHSVKVKHDSLDLTDIFKLTFEKPDTTAFPLLDAAREAIKIGGTAPTALIAADEVAVEAFLCDRLSFNGIASVVFKTLEHITILNEINEESLNLADSEARRICREQLSAFCK